MATITAKQQVEQLETVRQAQIPDDLSYMTETEFGREMVKLAAEIAEEQGTRTTEEINQLINLMRGNDSTNPHILTATSWFKPQLEPTAQFKCAHWPSSPIPTDNLSPASFPEWRPFH